MRRSAAEMVRASVASAVKEGALSAASQIITISKKEEFGIFSQHRDASRRLSARA